MYIYNNGSQFSPISYFPMLPMASVLGYGLADQEILTGTKEMTQQLRTYAALAQDLSLEPSTHTRNFTDTNNSSFRRPNTLFWTPQAPAFIPHTDKHTQTHTLTL